MHKIDIPATFLAAAAARRGRLHPFDALEAAKTALLVVDMQTAFVSAQSSFAAPTAREIVHNVNRLGAELRRRGGRVIWIVSTYGPAAEADWPVLFEHVMSGTRGRQFRQSFTEGDPGHALWPEMAREPEDWLIAKNRFSPFADPENRLERKLRAAGIDSLLVAGTVTNVCCESAARDAAMRDFKTVMIADANAARTDAEHNATLSTFIQVFGDVLTTDEAIEALH